MSRFCKGARSHTWTSGTLTTYCSVCGLFLAQRNDEAIREMQAERQAARQRASTKPQKRRRRGLLVAPCCTKDGQHHWSAHDLANRVCTACGVVFLSASNMPPCSSLSGAHDWRTGKKSHHCSICGRRDDGVVTRIRARGASLNTRDKLIARDGMNCHYCGILTVIHDTSITVRPDAFTMDHVIPRSKGGTNHLDNLRCACWKCNGRKADLLPHEFVVSPSGQRKAQPPSPQRERHTRLHTRADGKPKRSYPDLETALDTAEFLAQRDNRYMEAFECEECGDFHVRILRSTISPIRRNRMARHRIDENEFLILELGERAAANLKAENFGPRRTRRLIDRLTATLERLRKRDHAA